MELLLPTVGIEDPAEIKRHIAARLKRQEILARPKAPCRLHAVIDENVITRINSPEIRAPQLHHLQEMSEFPNVDLQIVPAEAGLYRGAGEAFTYLGFADPGERDIVFLETTIDARMFEEKDELRRYMIRFDQLCADSLSPEASRGRLLEVIP